MTEAYTSDEMMTVAAARQLHNGTVCFVGIGLPSTAANLARFTHAPDVVLIYESGTLGAKPDRLPLSIGDGMLAETADAVVSVPEVFNYWLQPGRIDVGFLSAAQIDRYANINTTVIGADYRHPEGPASRRGWRSRDRGVVPRGRRRAPSDAADVRRSRRLRHLGGLRAGARRPAAARTDRGAGPRVVITDFGVLSPDPETCELTLVSVHPRRRPRSRRKRGDRMAARGVSGPATTDPPTDEELTVLRRLEATKGGRERGRLHPGRGAHADRPPRWSARGTASRRPRRTRHRRAGQAQSGARSRAGR